MQRNSYFRSCRFLVAGVVLFLGASLAMSMQMYDNEPDGRSTAGANTSSVLRVSEDGSKPYRRADEYAHLLYDGDPKDAAQIVISKQSQTLSLYDSKGGLICCYPVSVGRNFGNKQVAGDLRTPEGLFSIEKIQDASWWGHDSGDGNGFVPHCYGNWFMRLKTPPHRGIGIHASIRRSSIGKRASEGCICLHSENLDKLRPLVRDGMKVVVETSLRDMEADNRCVILCNTPVRENYMYNLNWWEHRPVAYVIQDSLSHIVEYGDSYLSLAVKYGTTRKNLEILNPGVDPNELTVGEVIRVGGEFVVPLDYVLPSIYNSTAMVACTDMLYYEASEIDNFGRIAVMHSTTRARIIELNPGVNPDKLVDGQIVRVR